MISGEKERQRELERESQRQWRDSERQSLVPGLATLPAALSNSLT